jgi:predicted signal transduction protein with EAL and GGDEF domain
MTTPNAADTARLLKTQVATCLLVWLVTIAFWINGGSPTFRYISLALAVFDTALCGYLFVKFRALQQRASANVVVETSDETLRRLNDPTNDGGQA